MSEHFPRKMSGDIGKLQVLLTDFFDTQQSDPYTESNNTTSQEDIVVLSNKNLASSEEVLLNNE